MRRFSFEPSNEEIDETVYPSTEKDNKTIVELIDFSEDYQKSTPKMLEGIALRVLQHCLIYFLSPTCPSIRVRDCDESLSLNQLYQEKYAPEVNSEQIITHHELFQLRHIKIISSSNTGNHLYLCANNRLVEDHDLGTLVADLDDSLYKRFKVNYVGIMTGEYFDRNVDMNRLSFLIPKQDSEMLNELSMNEILSKASTAIEQHLSEYLAPIREEKQRRIQQYVSDRAPQFKHLIKYMPEDIREIRPSISEDALDDELHKIKRKFDRQVREESKDLLNEYNQELISDDEYQERFSIQVEKLSDANKAELANYVVHRRAVLDLFEKLLSSDENGKYDREKCIHKLIYPMGKTSEDIDYNCHNLWLIDERLSYCQYIASDKRLNSQKNGDRPDILFLQAPVAFSDEKNLGRPLSSITIFELKKPMRDDYSSSSNPIDQMLKYVEQIRDGKIRDIKGRPIQASEETMFYLYAICDITPSLKTILNLRSFTKMADGLGYYWYNAAYNAYIEVLPFDKILHDSQKRNRVLFDKLGLT